MRNFLYSILLLLPICSFSQYGVLDETFGDGGILIHNNFPSNVLEFFPKTIITDNDGNIYAAAVVRTEGGDEGTYDRILIAKYFPNGNHDVSFGEDGYVFLSYQNKSSYVSEIILTNDNSLFVVGSVTPIEVVEISWGVVFKIDLNGNYVNSFGDNGMLLIDFGNTVLANNIIEFEDNQLIVGGIYYTIVDIQKVFLMKLLENGELDSSFGNNGRKSIETNFYTYLLDLIIDGENSVYAVLQDEGITGLPIKSHLYKITSENEEMSTPFQEAKYTSVQLGDEGKIIVSGTIQSNGNDHFYLKSFLNDGTIDSEFGNNGEIIADIGVIVGETSEEYGNSHLVSPVNHRIIQIGATKFEGQDYYNFALVGYRKNGHFDNSFGSQSVTITDITNESHDLPVDASLMGTDRIVLLRSGIEGNTIACYKIYDGLSVEDLSSNSEIIIAPNPASNSFFISGMRGNRNQIQIFDLSGKLIREFNSVQDNQRIELGSIPKGIYIIKIKSNGKIESKKLIVR